MAAFATSSQRLHWAVPEDELDSMRALDLTYMSRNEYRVVQMYIYGLVKILSTKLNLRQQAVSTAMVYLLRFYTKVAFIETNIYMVMAAAVYLACKIEECPQHIKVVTTEIQTIWGLGKVSGESQKLAEAEFYLINELDTYLVVHHPYRILATIAETQQGWQTVIKEAWVIVNDAYNTDIPLTFEPDVIAYTAIFLAISQRREAVPPVTFPQTLVPAGIKGTDITHCTQSFLQFWQLKKSAKLNPEAVLRRAKDALVKSESGAHEKALKYKKYKEKIQAMQKK